MIQDLGRNIFKVMEELYKDVLSFFNSLTNHLMRGNQMRKSNAHRTFRKI